MIDVGCLNPTSQHRIGQPEQMFVAHPERFDQMNEAQPSSTSLSVMQALRKRIEEETPHLHVLDVYEYPHPYIKVKDTVNGIIVGFSSEADYTTYVVMMRRTEV